MTAFVFVESNTTGTGELFVRKALQRGYTVYFLTNQRDKYPFLRTLPVAVVRVDTSDHDKVHEFCTAIGEVSVVFSSSDYFIEVASAVAARLNLPTANTEAIRICRDKSRFAEVLGARDVPIPRSIPLSLPELSQASLERLPFPAVIKPRSGSGSVGVKRVADAGEAFRHCESLRKSGEQAALAQEYVAGAEYSVETLTVDGKTQVIAVVKKHLSPEPYFVEIGHSYPPMLNPRDQQRIETTVLQALQAVGYRFGPAHTELRLFEGVATIIEINPRLAGGLIPLMLGAVFDSDILDRVLDAWAGTGSFDDFVAKRHGAIRFALPREGGVLNRPIVLPDELRKHPAVAHFHVMKAPGDRLTNQAEDFRDRAAVVICAGDRPEEVAALAAKIVQELVIEVVQAPSGAGATDTGLPSELQAILYAHESQEDSFTQDLRYLCDLNVAHLIMLGETGIAETGKVRLQLKCHGELSDSRFAELRHRPRPRGLYMMLEQYLIERLGDEVGGILQAGRSRNDMNAAITKLKLRDAVFRVHELVRRLRGTLLFKASESLQQPFPIYSQYQPALPGTFAHQLLAYEQALAGEHRCLLQSLDEIGICPLGAGAGGGTTLRIDVERVCKLLGFNRPAGNSLDAVANRSGVVHFLSSMTGLGLLLSRFAQDLQLWTLSECALIQLPNCLYGGSSMLPQKRNPFLMEYIKGRASVPAGCYATAVGALSKTPYTNSFEVSSQLDHAIAESAKALEDTLTVARYLMEGARVDDRRVAEHLRIHAVTATAITEKLMVEQQMSFRAAHTKVGDTVRTRRERDESVHAALVELDASFMARRPIEWARSHSRGGGPGAVSAAGDLVGTYRSLAEDIRAFESFYSTWKHAAQMRRDIVAQVIARGEVP